MVVYDCIVVGGGILGLSTAYQLTKRKQKTLLLEQFNIPHSRGSSSGGSRLIRSVYPDKAYAALMPDSYKEWYDIQEKASSDIIRKTGLLVTQTTPQEFITNSLQSMKRDNLPHQVIDRGSKLKKQFPLLEYGDEHTSIVDPLAGILRANKCILALQKLILSQGGEIHEESKVLSIIPGDIVTVATESQTYKARSIILTPGPWAKELLEKVGLNLPIKTMPGYQTFWKLKEGSTYSSENVECPGILHWMEKPGGAYQFVYLIPTWEYPGLLKIGTRFEPNPQYLGPECRDNNGPGDIIPFLQSYVRKHLPFLHDKPSLIEPCMYAVTDDKHYIIDRHPKHSNILIGAGLSGHGFKTAPVLGKLLTELSMNEKPSYNISSFSLKRFHNIYTAKL